MLRLRTTQGASAAAHSISDESAKDMDELLRLQDEEPDVYEVLQQEADRMQRLSLQRTSLSASKRRRNAQSTAAASAEPGGITFDQVVHAHATYDELGSNIAVPASYYGKQYIERPNAGNLIRLADQDEIFVQHAAGNLKPPEDGEIGGMDAWMFPVSYHPGAMLGIDDITALGSPNALNLEHFLNRYRHRSSRETFTEASLETRFCDPMRAFVTEFSQKRSIAGGLMFVFFLEPPLFVQCVFEAMEKTAAAAKQESTRFRWAWHMYRKGVLKAAAAASVLRTSG